MSSDTEKKLPASTLFHRALLALIPAASLTLAAYHSGFAWYFIVRSRSPHVMAQIGASHETNEAMVGASR